jgi:integrase
MGDIAWSITAQIGGFADPADERWTARLLTLFPVPTVSHVGPLLDAVARVRNAVHWAFELDGAAEILEPIDRVRHRVAAASPNIGVLDPARAAERLVGDFDLAGALHGAGKDSEPAGVEALRLVLLICQWRWVESGVPRRSSVEILAAAIRGIGRGGVDHNILPTVLYQLGRATTLIEALTASEGILSGSHLSLAEAWRTHFDPELRQIQRPRGKTRPKSSGLAAPDTVGEPGRPSPKKSPGDVFDEDVTIDRLASGLRWVRIGGTREDDDAFPGELPDETGPNAVIIPLAKAPKSSCGETLLRYQALQAIRHSNAHLLPNHPDVIPIAVCGRIVQSLIDEIGRAPPGSRERVGAAGLLLVAITGRTARTLTALDQIKDAKASHIPGRMGILPGGALRMSVFWRLQIDARPLSYFRPDEGQERMLQNVGDEIELAMASPIADALKAARAELATLSRKLPDDIQAVLRDAGARVAAIERLDFTVGRLRASLAAHVFESCRDLALTQLITADSLGHSLAPLAYYAPQRQAVSDALWAVQMQMLGANDSPRMVRDGEQRIGALLMPRLDVVRTMSRAPSGLLHVGQERLLAQGREVEIHRSMVNQLATMLLAVATHRPTNALFEITRDDLLFEGKVGCALFRDKVVDAAHNPRMVVLPELVVRQIKAYFEHLSGLATVVPELRRHTEEVLAGHEPLLFGWDGSRVSALEMESWRKQIPPCWSDLPANWGRHWCRTTAVEAGIRPELVSIQLGHLESVGYPFSGASPLEPAALMAELAPQWNSLATTQGWRVVSGIPRQLAENLGPGPLKSWADAIHRHEAGIRDERRKWKLSWISRLRSIKLQALEDVRQHPELQSSGIIERYDALPPIATPHDISRADFERIRDELIEGADDLALGLARSSELCRIAKRVNRASAQTECNPAPIHVFRRPVDNALVPGMLLAVRQVRAMREHLQTMTDTGDWRDRSLACARVVVAVALFGFCDNPQRIMAAINRRHLVTRSLAMSDVLMVPCGDEPQDVLVLRGIAAIAFAHFARKHRSADALDWSEIDVQVRRLLPDWVGSDDRASSSHSSGWIERLCETVSVSNRFELSPAARMAGGRNGLVNACIVDQLALIDGDPAGTIARPHNEPVEPAAPTFRLAGAATGTGNARTQYLALCATMPNAGRGAILPLTNVQIPSGSSNAPANRALVVAEIDAMLAQDRPATRLQPIVALLAAWTRDMLANGTARRASPAFNTVETYLTRIGAGLVLLFGRSSLAGLGDDELERAYEFMFDTPRLSRGKVAASILEFHRFGMGIGVLPEVDLTPVLLHLGDEGSLPDARFILPQERTAAAEWLAREAARDDLEDGQRRILRQARIVYPLFSAQGARRAEALGIRFKDLAAVNDELHIRIRANSSRSLKTLAARRHLQLAGEQAASLTAWAEADRARLPSYRSDTAFVFSPIANARSAEERPAIAEQVLSACREATGRRDARIHALRHLVAMESIFACFTSQGDRESLAKRLQLKPLITARDPAILPRDIQAQIVAMGHADASTTLRWYVHLPWLLTSRANEKLQHANLNTRTMSALLGVTRHTLNWHAKKATGQSRSEAWLDIEIARRVVPDMPTSGPIVDDSYRPVQWTARRLGKLLRNANRLGSLVGALNIAGADPNAATDLIVAFTPIERRLGRRLINDAGSGFDSRRPRRTIRRMAQDDILERLWARFDEAENVEREALANLARVVMEHLNPKDLETIEVPAPDADKLVVLLKGLGFGEELITRELAGVGAERLRIRRPGAAEGNAGGFIGLGLKAVLAVIDVAARSGRNRLEIG